MFKKYCDQRFSKGQINELTGAKEQFIMNMLKKAYDYKRPNYSPDEPNSWHFIELIVDKDKEKNIPEKESLFIDKMTFTGNITDFLCPPLPDEILMQE